MNEYGLIGYPLQHSFSKKYFTDKFEKEGLNNNSFLLFPLTSISELPGIIQLHKNLKGLAVTIPYKEQVLSFLHFVDEPVKSIGAVNCIRVADGVLTGYNTDVTGFEKSFTPLLKAGQNKALILGTGGASKAVQYILNRLGIPFLLVTRKQISKDHISYSMITADILLQYPVIINCTPVGTFPMENDKPAIPYHLLSTDNFLYDLVYNPAQTQFLKEGIKFGASVKNGLDMLHFQAEENWRIWNTSEAQM